MPVLSLLLLTLGALCLGAYTLIGSQVDGQGFVHEPFALIPLAWLSLGLGGLLAVVHRLGKKSGK